MKSITGKNIVVTGAAQGLGKEMSLVCAREGGNIALIDINEKSLTDTKNELNGFNAKVQSYLCDISNKEDIDQTAEKIREDFKKIDILINNAAVITGKSIADCSYEELKRTMDVNLLGTIWITKQFLREMIDRNSGHIVTISSAAGIVATPKMGDYCATKAGILAFTDTLRMEMKKYNKEGVKVSCVCPSLIDTGMFRGFKSPFYAPALDPKQLAEKILRQAIQKEKSYVFAPRLASIAPFMKVFPAGFSDKLASLLGNSKAMDNFQGH